MFKFFWKSFVVGLLCNSLLLFNLAFAEVVNGPGGQQNLGAAMNAAMTASSGGTTTPSTTQTLNDGTTIAMDPILQKKYDEALLADISMVILASVTGRLSECAATNKNIPGDVQVAQAAGEAFEAGEVAEYSLMLELKETLNAMAKAQKDKTDAAATKAEAAAENPVDTNTGTFTCTPTAAVAASGSTPAKNAQCSCKCSTPKTCAGAVEFGAKDFSADSCTSAQTAGQALIAASIKADKTAAKTVKDANDTQAQSLRDLYASYQDIKNAIKDKKAIRTAAAAAYMQAADMAAKQAEDVNKKMGECSEQVKKKKDDGVARGKLWTMGLGAATLYVGYCYATCLAEAEAEAAATAGSGAALIHSLAESCKKATCIPTLVTNLASKVGMAAGGSGAAGEALDKIQVAAPAVVLGILAAMTISANDATKSCSSNGDKSIAINEKRKNYCQDFDDNENHVHEQTTEKPSGSTVSKKVTQKCLNVSEANAQNDVKHCGDSFFTEPGGGGNDKCDLADKAIKNTSLICPMNALGGQRDGDFYSYEPKKTQKDYVTIIKEMFLSSASAAGLLGAMGITEKTVVDFIKKQAPVFADAIDTQLSAPLWRAVAWASLSDMTTKAIGATDTMMAEIDKDMAKVQAILNAVLGNPAGTPVDTSAIPNFHPPSANSPTIDIPCSGESAIGCTPRLNFKTLGIDGNSGSLVSLTTSLNGLGLTTRGVSPIGATARAATDYSTLAGASKVGDVFRSGYGGITHSLRGNANASRLGSGIDASRRLSNGFTGIGASALSKLNRSAGDMRMMMSGGNPKNAKGNSFAADALSNVKSMKISPFYSSNAALANGGRRPVQGGFVFGKNKPNPNAGAKSNSTLDGDEQSAKDAALAAADAAALGKNAGLDMGMGDVSKDSSASIFELISERYQKSGYKKLFDQKAPATPVKK